MALRRTLLFVTVAAVVVLCALCWPWRGTTADEWLPIDAAELKMTSEPKAPGAPAIYLYRQVDRDDQASKEVRYARIKILAEEGRKRANVELPFVRGVNQIKNIEARTIRPNGEVANFDGKVYEQTILKARGVKVLSKVFTLPEVQVGSIIEYRYTVSWNAGPLYDSRWILSDDLFTKDAKFSLKPSGRFDLRWSCILLPPGALPTKDGKLIRLEVHDVAAFPEEDFMPPEDELKSRVDFVYGSASDWNDPQQFWKGVGKRGYEGVELFVNRTKAMQQAAAQIVSPNDDPEMKLRKIYARIQELRNTELEETKSEKELKREKEKENKDVEEVWKNQKGTGWELTALFLGLVRGAGFEAYPVFVSSRDKYFFNPQLMNAYELNKLVVLVKNNGKDLYFDPGTEFTPYGYLPWPETDVQGLRLDKDGGTWVDTSIPSSAEAVVTRVADLKITETGAAEGKLIVTYSGVEGQQRRLEERNEDDTEKKKFLEEEVKQWVPVPVEVELSNSPDWKSSAVTLTAEFKLKAEQWAVAAGRRMLVPLSLFAAQEKNLFEHESRVYPVYFLYPFETRDEVNIKLPLNWSLTSLPAKQDIDRKVLAYSMKVEGQQGVAHVSRTLKVDGLLFDVGSYGAVRDFFQKVRTSDQQQILAQPPG